MAFKFLLRWLRLARKQRPDLRVVVFTRATCPLCDNAWELLRRQQRRYGFTLEAKDIEQSAELMREYCECVPVVTINGQVRFRGQVNEVLLRRILEHSA
jgi:glutaredoxin